MKKLLILLIFSLIILPLTAQYKAKMAFQTMGQDRYFTVFFAKSGYRYEFNEDGQEGVVLVKEGSPELVILIPQQKIAMKGLLSNPMSMASDPVAIYKNAKEKGMLKEEGKEIVNGIQCTRYGLWNRENTNQKMYTIWLAKQYSFPIRLESHMDGSGESIMELQDIEPWTPDLKSLEIPEGYQVMEMPSMMR